MAKVTCRLGLADGICVHVVNIQPILIQPCSVCAGKDVANQILFITIATLLWAFNIEKAVDACGEPIIPPHGDFDLVDNGVAVYVLIGQSLSPGHH